MDPTNGGTTHPLTQRKEIAVPAPTQTDTTNVTIVNRPRFTPIEALILNLLVNRHPDWVPFQEIRRYISPFTWGSGSDDNIRLHITSLRAKLGERLRDPRQIVSIKRRYKNRYGELRLWHVGYRWVNPGETFIDADEDADA